MKKIYYLLSFVAVAMAFTACNPMDKTYKELGDLPQPSAPAVTANVTLAAADYAFLPSSNYAKTSLNFKTQDDAKTSVPVILAAKYPNYSDKSSLNVTYNVAPVAVKPADSTFVNVAYTLLPADYTVNGGVNTFTNFSATQIITWLGIKYPAAVENKLAVITFNFFESGSTTTVTQSFLFMGGVWNKIYHITAAQYTSIGKGGTNNNFASADVVLLPAYFNTFLKADAAVAATAKAGDVKYVSYKYYGGSTVNTFQRVLVLTFDGTNWTTTSAPASLVFAKANGVWVADNTVNYRLTDADHIVISGLTFGSVAARANLASFKSVDLRPTSTTKWLPEEIAAGVAAFAKIKYGATAAQNQIFNLSYNGYTGTYAYVVVKLKYVGTDFVIQP